MSNWINLSERCPEYYTEVIVSSPSEEKPLIGKFVMKNGQGCFRVLGRKKTLDDVTHWMPLPENPK